MRMRTGFEAGWVWFAVLVVMATPCACGSSEGASCDGAVAALSSPLAEGSACTAVLELAYGSLEPVGWVLRCGPAVEVSEADAQATADEELQLSRGVSNGSDILSPPDPADVYVFHDDPSDTGAVSIVSARSGLPLFSARLNWSAPGTVVRPESWEPADQLGDCGPVSLSAPHRTYDFARDSLDPTVDEEARVLAAIGRTAIPRLSSAGVSDVVLVRLQRTVEGSNQTKSTATWFVLVDF